MEFPRRLALLRPRRRRRAALAVGLVLFVWAVGSWMRRPDPLPQGRPATLASVRADAAAQDRAGAASANPGRGTASSGAAPSAARVPDVPAAWSRIRKQAQGWPSPDVPPALGVPVQLPTVPASRVRDTIGANVDLWRTGYAWKDFPAVLRKIRELRLRHARVGMQSGATYGLARMQQLGQAGVRLDVLMGDAYGRFGTAPFSALSRRLRESVLPYVDAVEGTNEADLTRRPDWVAVARRHQERVVASVAAQRGRPVGVIAPSVGRQANAAELGDVSAIADAGNAHAYSSGGEPGRALAQWLTAIEPEVPGGAVIVTEAGFQTDLGQRKYHTPTSPRAAAAYVPRTILEAIRRGVPQVYLYELVDRWSDPFGIDTAAHFGLLEHDLEPKPAWGALVRLQRALLDGGRPDIAAAPLPATVDEGPDDLRVLALRKRDGSVALALWRAVPVWDAAAGRDLKPAAREVHLRVPGIETSGALVTDVVSGKRRRLGAGAEVQVGVAGSPIIVTGLRRAG